MARAVSRGKRFFDAAASVAMRARRASVRALCSMKRPKPHHCSRSRRHRDPRRAAEQPEGLRSRSAARQAERHLRAERQREVDRSPSTRSTRRGSGATWRRSRPTRGSSSSGWTSRRWTRSAASRRRSRSSRSNPVKTTRSTVGTMTEINDYLKLLFPRVVAGALPGVRAARSGRRRAQSIVEQVFAQHAGETRARDLRRAGAARRRSRRSSSPSSSSRAICASGSMAKSCASDEPRAGEAAAGGGAGHPGPRDG